jgi:hypothetical protein
VLSATLPEPPADSAIWFDSDAIIDRRPNPLLAAKVSLGRLNRDMSQQELDLLQFAACSMAQTSARPPQVVRGQFRHTDPVRAIPLIYLREEQPLSVAGDGHPIHPARRSNFLKLEYSTGLFRTEIEEVNLLFDGVSGTIGNLVDTRLRSEPAAVKSCRVEFGYALPLRLKIRGAYGQSTSSA